MDKTWFNEGDHVQKTTGDYVFYGVVVAVIRKRGGDIRYAVENGHGILHIFSAKQLTSCPNLDEIEGTN